MMLWGVKSPKALKQIGDDQCFPSIPFLSHAVGGVTNPCGSPGQWLWGEQWARAAPWREIQPKIFTEGGFSPRRA